MVSQEGIADFLKESGADAVFIQKDENCRYISGFTGSDSYLFLTKDASYLLTDSRYTEQAAAETSCEVVNAAGKLPQTVAALSAKHHVRRLGVEGVLSYRMYLSFDEVLPDTEFLFCETDTLRQIKSEEELRMIEEACRISDAGFAALVPRIAPGKTEAELRTILECAMLEAGSEGKSFDTIVASGERGAYPHGTATDKVVCEGELITFDFGAIYKGYHSDITRTVALGEISARQRFLYDSVLECVLAVEKNLRAGKRACDVDKEARDFLKERELDRYFTHALGHSVGLEIHEAPVLAARDTSILRSGMTETVEPGVYIPGIGGVRIEDTVSVHDEGISIFTKFPKEFLCITGGEK